MIKRYLRVMGVASFTFLLSLSVSAADAQTTDDCLDLVFAAIEEYPREDIEVRRIQTALVDLGYLRADRLDRAADTEIDGALGTHTRAALCRFARQPHPEDADENLIKRLLSVQGHHLGSDIPSYRLTEEVIDSLRGPSEVEKAIMKQLSEHDYPQRYLYREALTALAYRYRSAVEKLPELVTAADRADLAAQGVPDIVIDMIDADFPQATRTPFLREHLPDSRGFLLRRFDSLAAIETYTQNSGATATLDADKARADNRRRVDALLPPRSFLEAQRAYAGESDPNVLITIEADTCGCEVTVQQGREVYGFLPLWGVAAEQTLNFGVYSRLALVGHVMDSGRLSLAQEIADPAGWQAKRDAVSRLAHQYRTKVDTVVLFRNWQGWSTERTAMAVADIAAMLRPPEQTMAQRIDTFLTSSDFGRSGGDGLVLWVDELDLQGAAVLNELIVALDERLAAQDVTISVLLSGDGEVRGAALNLVDQIPALLARDRQDRAMVRDLLFFLDEPTAVTKLDRRTQLESRFTGARRQELLRKAVPVSALPPVITDAVTGTPTSYETLLADQFRDDMLYYADNFGGFATWGVLGLESEAASGDLNALTQNIIGSFWFDTDGDAFAPDEAGLCHWICIHRGGVRILAGSLLLFLALVWGGAAYSCRVRAYLQRGPTWLEINFERWLILGLLLAVIGVGVALLSCDPDAAPVALVVLVGALAVVLLLTLGSKFIPTPPKP